MTGQPNTLYMTEETWKLLRDEALPKPYGLKVSEIEAAALRGVMNAIQRHQKGNLTCAR